MVSIMIPLWPAEDFFPYIQKEAAVPDVDDRLRSSRATPKHRGVDLIKSKDRCRWPFQARNLRSGDPTAGSMTAFLERTLKGFFSHSRSLYISTLPSISCSPSYSSESKNGRCAAQHLMPSHSSGAMNVAKVRGHRCSCDV